MKEVMLCVILIVAGALADSEKADSKEKSSISATNSTWYGDEGPCCQLCYTQWFDRDDPTGKGDWETLADLKAEYPGKICRYPCAIQVQTLKGAEAYTTGQVFQSYDTLNGFVCLNKPNKKCLDYKVRFACPC